MNKKLTNILRTNITLYFICLVLFALAAIPFDVRLAIGEGAAAVVLLIIARRRSRSVQQSMRQYMDRFTASDDGVRHGHPGRGVGQRRLPGSDGAEGGRV